MKSNLICGIANLLHPNPCIMYSLPQAIRTQMPLGLQHIGQGDIRKQCGFSVVECQSCNCSLGDGQRVFSD